jgi:hypothetical protein
MGRRNCDHAVTGGNFFIVSNAKWLALCTSTGHMNPCGPGFGALYGHRQSSLGTALSVLRNLHMYAVAAESYRINFSSH